jgi:hypothetical protein
MCHAEVTRPVPEYERKLPGMSAGQRNKLLNSIWSNICVPFVRFIINICEDAPEAPGDVSVTRTCLL